MKKVLFSIISLMAVISFISCADTQKKTEPTKPQIIEEGWISGDEFRVKVSGTTNITSSDSEALKKSSEAAAVKKAQETVVKNFVTTRMKQSPGAGTYAVIALSIDKDFRDTIEAGKIISKSFSADNKSCTIVYQVSKSGLKNTVEQKK